MAMKAMKKKAVLRQGKFTAAVSKTVAARKSLADAKEVEEAPVPMKTVTAKRGARASLKRPAAANVEVQGAQPPATKRGKKATAAAEKAGEELAVVERTKELKAMAVADLKDVVQSKGLDKGTKLDMIAALLKLEAKARDEGRAREAKALDAVNKIREGIAAKANDELKAMCVDKGLKLGGSKADRVDRLVAHARESGEVDRVLANTAQEARRTELVAMDKEGLKKLCEKLKADPLVKEVMIERILAVEAPKVA